MALKIENLTGGYSGINVIKNVNLTIEPGQAVGLIGLNGAGKSTTIKHLLGLLRMQKGKITLNGVSLTENSAEFKKMVAYIPETPILYPELTLKEHLELVMLTYGLDKEKAWVRAKELCKMFRLENKLDWLPINFSKGMKQKVMIVTSFLANADLLVIDEPFTGLDPLAVANFIDLVKKAVADQKMVLMTTHVLAEAQEAVQTFAVLNNGTIETEGSLTEIRQFYGLKPSDSFDRLYQILNQKTVKKHD
ncbi:MULTISPECIES: ABC transporter ATP-binding protein [Lactobacillus]|uniref:ABC transporter ATP-binding protein n=1 Tax=Lactobacillus gasseri TaxID=1596 RepID=A0A8A4V3C1_LACGS|nr:MULTISPECIES: ABC transporter ATP-binding protein [Lactobacillus]MBW8451430.1 ABC transporter ATP-binding protein [Lactobacillus paragasseri]MYM18150.1 ATP-binding cassette domain-containing protein [Lactobacillus gasseri]QTD67042.1 ABC transporter ATP-binding protein [Lactobacillus gasseri]